MPADVESGAGMYSLMSVTLSRNEKRLWSPGSSIHSDRRKSSLLSSDHSENYRFTRGEGIPSRKIIMNTFELCTTVKNICQAIEQDRGS